MSLRVLLIALFGFNAIAKAAPSHLSAIEISHIHSHLQFLAGDLLEGREAGTRGYDIAASYVSTQFELMGLQPAGNRRFLQRVPLRRSVLRKGSLELRLETARGQATFTEHNGVVARPGEIAAEQDVAADCVFAGYGVVAPEFKRDDFAGLEVRGRFVVVLGGPAPGLPSEIAAHLSSPDELGARAAERGAAGVLIIYTPALEARWPFANLPEIYDRPQYRWIDRDHAREDEPRPRVSAMLSMSAAAALFEGAPSSLDQVMMEATTRAPNGFPLRAHARFRRKSEHTEVTSDNVLALLPGTDPALASETIVFASHLDHVGIGQPRNGDRIYNGALDNAIGISSMLEIARVLKSGKPALRRSVLFIATTAEEKGLVGADYFVHNPTIPLTRLVGVINLDGAMPFFDLVDVIGYGAESSSLGDSLRTAALRLDITVSPDPNPGQGYFTRSDHYPFVRRGIPGVYLIAGDAQTPDGKDAAQISRRWAVQHLHQPSDDLNQPFDDGHLEKWAELHLQWLAEAANATDRPLWYTDDFFGRRFASKAKKIPRP